MSRVGEAGRRRRDEGARGRPRAAASPPQAAGRAAAFLAAAAPVAVMLAAAALTAASAVAPAAAAPLAGGATVAQAAAPPPPEPARTDALYRLRSAVLPLDGVLLLGLGGESYGIDYFLPDGRLDEASLRDLRLSLGYGLLPGVRLDAALTRRSWSDPAGLLPESGGGWGGLHGGVAVALPSPTPSLAWALHGGLTVPLGDEADGAAEAAAAPEAGASLTARLWRRSRFPELRLHLNAGWRGNPDGGRTGGAEARLPWPPLYPAAPAGRGVDNDERLWGGVVELRRGLVSLFVEYSEAVLPRRSGVAPQERARCLTSGLHWGGAEGWGLSLAYDVSLALDDTATAFVPAYPDLVVHLCVSRALALGGRDRDRDGIPDRRDACPTMAEDRDGWLDQDGCPDPDNDGDGVPDAVDGQPFEPEDRDGYLDEDGVPDLDNDGDGVPDARDACPDEAEDRDGDRDEDGCPEASRDTDGDGIADDRDHCPGLAEDRDGFEDEDGCPDADNDLDGIDDARDACPDAAEDYDGDRDDDGCPEGEAAPAGTSGAGGTAAADSVRAR